MDWKDLAGRAGSLVFSATYRPVFCVMYITCPEDLAMIPNLRGHQINIASNEALLSFGRLLSTAGRPRFNLRGQPIQLEWSSPTTPTATQSAIYAATPPVAEDPGSLWSVQVPSRPAHYPVVPWRNRSGTYTPAARNRVDLLHLDTIHPSGRSSSASYRCRACRHRRSGVRVLFNLQT